MIAGLIGGTAFGFAVWHKGVTGWWLVPVLFGCAVLVWLVIDFTDDLIHLYYQLSTKYHDMRSRQISRSTEKLLFKHTGARTVEELQLRQKHAEAQD